MKLFIEANRFYPGKRILITYNENELFEKIPGLNERLRIVLVYRGTGIVRIGDIRTSVIAPAIFCINEEEDVCLEEELNWAAKSFYFHPQYLNNNLSFDKIRKEQQQLSITERQDSFLFEPFIKRSESYIGQVNIDPRTLTMIVDLFQIIKDEISEQKDRFWSCRARSYFLELLFCLIRIYETWFPLKSMTEPLRKYAYQMQMLFHRLLIRHIGYILLLRLEILAIKKENNGFHKKLRPIGRI